MWVARGAPPDTMKRTLPPNACLNLLNRMPSSHGAACRRACLSTAGHGCGLHACLCRLGVAMQLLLVSQVSLLQQGAASCCQAAKLGLALETLPVGQGSL